MWTALGPSERTVADGGSWLDPAVTGRVLAIYRSAAPLRGGRDPGLDALTARESEVLALIGQGKSNTEIADELFVSEGTVKTHINHLFTKLQLRDRAAAVVFAFDQDLVTPRRDRSPPPPSQPTATVLNNRESRPPPQAAVAAV
jgi:DNA-binding NarL/FixJ family response regulator